MGRPKKIVVENEETPVDGTIVNTQKNAVSFNLKNGTTRTFTPEIHGENYEDLAAEFQKTNEHKIIVDTSDE